jgi:3-methyladenine DNA glycosylase/8-oxoguanine DNA glycosylase
LLGAIEARQIGPPHARSASDLSWNRKFEVPALAGSDRLEAGHQTSEHAQRLEVAMGLEIAHPEILEKLNKRMSLDQFRRAADFLRAHEIGLRVFVLVQPPFVDEAGAMHWARRSIDFAFECGATVVSLIPTRLGNGALEALVLRGEFSPPKISTLESALDFGIGLQRGRVFADLWDLERFSDCPACFEPRRARLHQMNLAQVVRSPVECERCSRRAR